MLLSEKFSACNKERVQWDIEERFWSMVIQQLSEEVILSVILNSCKNACIEQ